jgi:hypothetical protein
MRLTRIGYWLGDTEKGWPDPRRFVDPSWDEDTRQLVVAHLHRGLVSAAYCGPSRCRFCGIVNGSLELSDGVFVWPEGLAHYVESHGVRLPERFVEHARTLAQMYETADVDDEWWRAQSSIGSG